MPGYPHEFLKPLKRAPMSIKILNITDLHIISAIGGEVYGVDSFESLQRVLDLGLSLNPDLIIATGDLVEHGDSASYLRLHQLLRSTGIPVFVLPGNHDSPQIITEELCGENIQFIDSHDQGGWRMIFLDSHVDDQGYGELSPAQLCRLHEALEQSASLHVLVAIHHTPIAPCPSFNCQLVGAGELLETLASWPNVRAVISGHTHIECDARFKGIQVMTTPATSVQCIHEPAATCTDLVDFHASHHLDTSRHGFRILDLEADGTFRSEVHWVVNPTAKESSC